MNVFALAAAAAVAIAVAAAATMVVPPTGRLAPRVRPYALVARTQLGRAAVLNAPRLDVLQGLQRLVERRSDEHLARVLRQAGRTETPAAFRTAQTIRGIVAAVAGGVAGAVLLRTPALVLVVTAAGFAWGTARSRGALERAVAARAERIRQELYTVNHLLAMHVRTGAGAMQAVQRIVQRSGGVVASELRDVLAATRRGVGEAEAFRRAAELTPEPAAARSYRLLAVGIERGADLGPALLALSQDLRDARREQLHKDAVKRRAAMLIPTIAILAPIMLLFVAAPLPSIVLGQ